MEMVPLPESKTVAVTGEWGVDSGGCDLNPFWFARNPRYTITAADAGPLSIMLKRLPGGWKKGATTLDKMIGFYVVPADDAQGSVAQLSKAQKVEAAFVPLDEVSLTYTWPAADTGAASAPAVVVVPCTYGTGCCGRFQLSVSAPTPAFEMVQQE